MADEPDEPDENTPSPEIDKNKLSPEIKDLTDDPDDVVVAGSHVGAMMPSTVRTIVGELRAAVQTGQPQPDPVPSIEDLRDLDEDIVLAGSHVGAWSPTTVRTVLTEVKGAIEKDDSESKE